MVGVRKAVAADVPKLVPLLERYMRETFDRPWSGSAEALARDGLGARFDTLLAVDGEAPIGFACVAPDYDLHHCVHGGVLMDLFVERAWRVRGVAVQLVILAAVGIAAHGGRYLKAQATAAASQAMARRVAVTFPGVDCIVGGRAFRRIVELHGRPLREIVRALPPPRWNWES